MRVQISYVGTLLWLVLAGGTVRSQNCPDPPIASFQLSGDTLQVCLDEVIALDGSGSLAAPGRSVVQWHWNTGSELPVSFDSPLFSASFSTGGYRAITLSVTDNEGCTSSPSGPLHVLVGPRPFFSITQLPPVICTSIDYDLLGQATGRSLTTYSTYCNEPMQSMESEFTIEVAGYDEGAMVEDTLTLPEIIIDFEHSYMGDLLITIRCPSDSVVTLHQQGGFNTFLGEPVDGDDSNPIPGICWEYRFNADPDFGTWEDCANNGVTENVVPIGSFNYALIPGSYTSIDPLDNLVGCPLNGTWTLGIFDLIAQDNGFLCSWCLSLSETPQIALQDLQPKLGLTSLDSNYWAGPNISNVAPGVSIFTPQIPGPATLNYVVVDSYGCVHDTSMVLNVLDALPVQLIDGSGDASCAVVEGVGFAQDYTYEWFYSGVSYGETGPCWTPPGNGHVSVIVTDPFGCSGEAMDATVGLSAENTPLGMELQILPTVNDGEFTLEIAQATAQIGLLRVLDMTGRTAHIEQLGLLPGQVTLPVSLSVPPGPYIVEVTTDGQQAQQRIVVR